MALASAGFSLFGRREQPADERVAYVRQRFLRHVADDDLGPGVLRSKVIDDAVGDLMRMRLRSAGTAQDKQYLFHRHSSR
jgi:hypothetical protein